MYGHTSQPSSDPDDYEIGKVAIHCSFIVSRFSTYVYQRVRCRNSALAIRLNYKGSFLEPIAVHLIVPCLCLARKHGHGRRNDSPTAICRQGVRGFFATCQHTAATQRANMGDWPTGGARR